MSRRFPYWRVTLLATILTVIVCLLAGAGVANASDTGDGSGGCHTFQYRDVWGTILYYWTVCRGS